jgi:DNA polymerase-1
MAVVADLAGEQNMLGPMKDGLDIHTSTMSQLWKQNYDRLAKIMETRSDDYPLWKKRRVATKRVNFGILYGISAKRLHLMLKLEGIDMSEDECHELINNWLFTYKDISRWMEDVRNEARRTSQVRAVTGQVRRLPGANRYDWVGGRKLRQATNFPVQHTASTLLIAAMVLVDEWFTKRGGAWLLMNVHDQIAGEFLGDAADFTAKLDEIMTQRVPEEFARLFGHEFTVPLRVDININERWT